MISIAVLGFTYRTIWIMRKQREDANRPYLVLDFNYDFDNIFRIDPTEEDYGDWLSYDKKLYSIDKAPFDFKVKNIGNGVAREIKVIIKVENIDIIKKDEKMYIEDNVLVVDYPEQTDYGYLKHKHLDDWNLYFSNLGSNNSLSLTNNLQRFEDIVNSILFYYMNNEDRESIGNHLIPTIKIELEYENILNKKFKESYSIDINPRVYGTSISSTFTVILKNNRR
jgi:hypothetical protein